MSDSNKKKQEFYLSVNETAEKLRALADELEKGVVTIKNQQCSIAADTEVKISLKAKGDTFSSKLKFKLAVKEKPQEIYYSYSPSQLSMMERNVT